MGAEELEDSEFGPFFVDIEGAANAPRVSAALAGLKPLTEELKLRGSYPVL